MPHRPQDYAPRDLTVLEHTALYRLGTYAVLEKLYFDGKQCGNALSRLAAENPADPQTRPAIRIHKKSLPKGRSYIQLTTAGCRQLGVTTGLAAPLGKAALDQAIAIEFACALSSVEFHRAKRSELVPFFGSDTPADNVPHLVTPGIRGAGVPTVLRVYQAMGDVYLGLKSVARILDESRNKRGLSGWVASGNYGVVVLCPTRPAVMAMGEAMNERRVLHDCVCFVELGPTSETLDEALKGSEL